MTHVQIKRNNGSVEVIDHIFKPFRNCRLDDFESRGYMPDEQFQKMLKMNNFCPSITQNDEFYRVENKYSN